MQIATSNTDILYMTRQMHSAPKQPIIAVVKPTPTVTTGIGHATLHEVIPKLKGSFESFYSVKLFLKFNFVKFKDGRKLVIKVRLCHILKFNFDDKVKFCSTKTCK